MISHRRRSDEIDVFEASMYFSGTSEDLNLSWDEMSRGTGTRRMNLDFPIQNPSPIQPLMDHNQEKKQHNNNKKSSKNKFAIFLKSFFFHRSSSSASSSKNKKSRKVNSSTMVDVDSIAKRSNSMSHPKLQNASTNFTRKSYNSTDGFDLYDDGGKKLRVHFSPRRRCSWRREEEDGGESDSSSDLFDLPSFRIWDLK